MSSEIKNDIYSEPNEQIDTLIHDFEEAFLNAPTFAEANIQREKGINFQLPEKETSKAGRVVVEDSHLIPIAFDVMYAFLPSLEKDWGDEAINHELDHFNRVLEAGVKPKLVFVIAIDNKKLSEDGKNVTEGQINVYTAVEFSGEGLSREEQIVIMKEMASAPRNLSEADKRQVEGFN